MPPGKNRIPLALRGRIGTIGQDRIATTGPLSEATIPIFPQAARPAVSEREIGAGGVPGCSGMPGAWKSQPAPGKARGFRGQDTVEGHGGDDGGQGRVPPVGGSKGPEPLASPNVLHWVGWLPGTTRCGAGPAVPSSHGAAARRARGVQVEVRPAETELRPRPSAPRSSGSLSGPAIPVSPQAAGPAVPEREIGPGGVSGCSGMPGSEKVQPARQSSRIQGSGHRRSFQGHWVSLFSCSDSSPRLRRTGP